MRPGPLKRGKPLQRRTALKRGKGLKRHPRPPRPPLEQELAQMWRENLHKRCANCGCTSASSRIEGHHVVRVQIIRDHARTLGVDGEKLSYWVWDERNRLPLCELCHSRRHRRLPALKWALIEAKAAGAIEFAEQVGLLWRAKLDYDLED